MKYLVDTLVLLLGGRCPPVRLFCWVITHLTVEVYAHKDEKSCYKSTDTPLKVFVHLVTFSQLEIL